MFGWLLQTHQSMILELPKADLKATFFTIVISLKVKHKHKHKRTHKRTHKQHFW